MEPSDPSADDPSDAPPRGHLLEGLIVFVAFWALYVYLGASTVQAGDAGEFMTIAGSGGVAHPPGYPLFSWICRLFGALAPGPVALRATMASATCAAAALAIVHVVVSRLTRDGLAGLAAAGLLGLTHAVAWRATTVDVQSLNALTAALLIAVSARAATDPRACGPRWGFLLGLAAATGIANHHTVVFLLPLCLWTLWRILPRDRSHGPTVVASAVGIAPGFLAYATLALPGGVWRWGETTTPRGLLHHFLREDYGTFSLASQAEPVAWYANPLVLLSDLGVQWLYVGAAFGVWGVVAGLRERRLRGWTVALAASFLLAGPAFQSLAQSTPTGYGRLALARFEVLPWTLFAPLVGLGAGDLLRRIGPRPWLRIASALVLVVGLGISAHRHLPNAAHRGWTPLEDYVHNALRVAEPGAVLVIYGDAMHQGFLYAQAVQHLRPDVTVVNPDLRGQAWYRASLERDPDLRLPPNQVQHPGGQIEALTTPRWVAALALGNRHHRPVHVAFQHLYGADPWLIPHLLPHAAVYLRVSTPNERPLTPAALERAHDAALASFTVRTSLRDPRRTASFEAEVFRQYSIAYRLLSGLHERAGDLEAATRCLERAKLLDPL